MKQPQGRFMTVLGGYVLDRHNHCELVREYIKPSSGDTGADPIEDGKFRMVPSGDIVDLAERNKRLAK